MSDYLGSSEVDRLLSLQLHEGNVVFANGQHANNHLDLGYDETVCLCVLD
jgi:hypothetical protein